MEDQDVVVNIPADAEGTEIDHLALYSIRDNVRVTPRTNAVVLLWAEKL